MAPTLGVQGVAPALGVQAVAPALGVQGVAPALGVQGVAPALGVQAVAPALGEQGVAPALGVQGVAPGLGVQASTGDCHIYYEVHSVCAHTHKTFYTVITSGSPTCPAIPDKSMARYQILPHLHIAATCT